MHDINKKEYDVFLKNTLYPPPCWCVVLHTHERDSSCHDQRVPPRGNVTKHIEPQKELVHSLRISWHKELEK